MVAGAGAMGPQAGLALVNNEPQKKASDHRRSNKPIMEKRRRARINNCLNELKTLILDAMKKDPARHSKLEKADILEMTVRHLESLQRQQNAMASATDPGVLNKFRAGYSSCAGEVGRFPGLEPNVKRRLLQHLANCLVNVTGTNAAVTNNGTDCHETQDTKRNEIPILPAPSTENSHQKITENHQIQLSAHQNGIFYTNYSSGDQQAVQLIPTRLPNGDIALILPQTKTNQCTNEISTPNVRLNAENNMLHQQNQNVLHLPTNHVQIPVIDHQNASLNHQNTSVNHQNTSFNQNIINLHQNTVNIPQNISLINITPKSNATHLNHIQSSATKSDSMDSNLTTNINLNTPRALQYSPVLSYESPPTPPKSSHNGETPERLETYSPDFIVNNRALSKKIQVFDGIKPHMKRTQVDAMDNVHVLNEEIPERLNSYSPDFNVINQNNNGLSKKLQVYDDNGLRKPMKRTLADTMDCTNSLEEKNRIQNFPYEEQNIKIMKLNNTTDAFSAKYEQESEYAVPESHFKRISVKMENESDVIQNRNQEPISLVVRRPKMVYQIENDENGPCWRPW